MELLGIILAVVLVTVGYLLIKSASKEETKHHEDPLPPTVTGIPLLGNALSYKKDPVQFMLSQKNKHGGIFSINLAGNRMVIIGDPVAMHAVHVAHEDVLSSSDAVSDFGFEIALGVENALYGSYIHRDLVKVLTQKKNEYIPSIAKMMKLSMLEETQISSKTGDSLDFLPFVRKVFLRTMIRYFISEDVISKHPSWPDDFYVYQDALEDAIAKANVLPKSLGKRYLKPVEEMRLKLREKLVPIVEDIKIKQETVEDQPDKYLKELISASANNGYFSSGSAIVVADYCIGMLFAAHKNPGILAAQTFLQLIENPVYLQKVSDEIEKYVHNVDAIEPDVLNHLVITDNCIKETLRMTSHTIGAIRKVKQPFKLHTEDHRNYSIPVGYYIGASHILMSMDEQFWTLPKIYDPDRFSSNRREEVQNSKSFVPFSGGVHICPGRYIAGYTTKIFLCLWIMLFESKIIGTMPKICFEKATLAQRKSPSFVEFHQK